MGLPTLNELKARSRLKERDRIDARNVIPVGLIPVSENSRQRELTRSDILS